MSQTFFSVLFQSSLCVCSIWLFTSLSIHKSHSLEHDLQPNILFDNTCKHKAQLLGWLKKQNKGPLQFLQGLKGLYNNLSFGQLREV